MATLAQFRTIVENTVGLDTTAAGTDESLVDGWVNDAVKDLLVRTQARQRTATLSMSSGVRDYTLDTSIYALVTVYNSTTSSNYLMSRLEPDEIYQLRVGGAGSPPAQFYAMAGADTLLLHPTPGSGETLQILYVPAPTALSASSDTPSEIPSEWHDAIKLYALAKAGEYAQHRPSGYGQTWWAQYEKRVREIKTAIIRKGGGRLSPARLNPIRYVPHDRSTYP